MRIPHDSLVMVADGAKALFFRNRGDGEYPNLEVVTGVEQADQADRDLKSGPAGRAPGNQGTMGEANYHDQAEHRFAADAAAQLNARALSNDYEKLIIVADPRTLGEMRKHYHKALETRLIGEIAKDLTGQPVDRIEKAIAAA